MTVSSSKRKAGPFIGNGATTAFPFAFKVFDKTDIAVVRVNSSGVSAQLLLDSDYSVALSSDQNNNPGGSIVYPITGTPLPSGFTLVILGSLPYDQTVDLTNSGGFYPEVVEDMVDRVEVQVQQLAELASRAIVVNESEDTPSALPPATSRGNTLLGFDALGNVTALPITASVGAGSLTDEVFVDGIDYTSGSSTSVTLGKAYGDKANLGAVVMSGIVQDPDSYSLSGKTLSFNTPIPAGIPKIWLKGGTTLSEFIPPNQSVADPQLSWVGLLERQALNIAELQSLSTVRYSHAHTSGYYTAGDGGGDAFYAVASGSASITPAVLGDIAASDGGVWRRVFKGRVNSKQLGLFGDGNQNGTAGTDQTTLFQSILNSLPAYTTLEFLPGYYNVKSIDFTSVVANCTFIFYDAWISGISTSAFDAIVRLNGCNNNKFYNLQIVSDGAAPTPVHQQNYGCALQFKGDSSLVPAVNTCFNYFYGGSIRYIKAGISYGSLLGQAAMPASQMSENWFFGIQFRGVLQPVYGNAINSYSTWVGCNFLAQRMESNASWWNDSLGFCVRNDYNDIGNHMVMIGCEYQRGIQNGTSIFGANMTIRDAIWEVGCQAVLTGDNLISGDADGFFGPAGLAPFAIATGSTGTLTLEDFRLSRTSGVAATDRAKLVDATGSINFRVLMRKCHIQEFYFEGFEGGATFVHGCQAKFEDVTIDNATTTSWYLDDGRANAINNVDRSGTSIPTSGTTSSFGGWVVTANAPAGAYRQLTGDGPFGLNQCIQVVTTSDGLNLATDTTNRFKVEGNRDYHFAVPLKFMTTTSTAYFTPVIDWYDYGGNLISSQNLGRIDQTYAAATGFNSWQMYRAPAKAPVNAYSAAARFIFGAGATIGFCLPSLN
ncbi:MULTISPECIES: hypothetical protein [unclassified Caballeronia]|uniref:hypothetical protein n=1 Tax=unclassified Caballeronia TaxID=2646786 RepID=UPI0028542E13|nr:MULTISPECIES: hypothetical protein [unclassified Caballeronia]MDR5772075.1 hypothetical protein [Caballeronia sp. LZ002]MDR5847509.1 hypothetical protein [Caballeronia sp. LZ003]